MAAPGSGVEVQPGGVHHHTTTHPPPPRERVCHTDVVRTRLRWRRGGGAQVTFTIVDDSLLARRMASRVLSGRLGLGIALAADGAEALARAAAPGD